MGNVAIKTKSELAKRNELRKEIASALEYEIRSALSKITLFADLVRQKGRKGTLSQNELMKAMTGIMEASRLAAVASEHVANLPEVASDNTESKISPVAAIRRFITLCRYRYSSELITIDSQFDVEEAVLMDIESPRLFDTIVNLTQALVLLRKTDVALLGIPWSLKYRIYEKDDFIKIKMAYSDGHEICEQSMKANLFDMAFSTNKEDRAAPFALIAPNLSMTQIGGYVRMSEDPKEGLVIAIPKRKLHISEGQLEP
jgi:hypothetical protein